MKKALIAVAAAALGPAVLWLVVAGLGGHSLTATSPEGETIELTLGFITLVALVFALLGWGFLALLRRLLPRRATLIWTIVGTALLLVSFVPLTGEMSTATRLTLGAMHLLVAIPLFALALRRTSPRTAVAPAH
ncbi:DUF6069 family protein [Catenuloplanes japonicus]|uniref:DUF6069 family protein n=1 Tax=Catenuloplanes japonicus TaxID=33876 RepID=UPI0007C4C668|nr:DUF6069 family protein [Catenuloplanes japonicus]